MIEAKSLVGLSTFEFLAFNRRGVFYPFLAIYAFQQLNANLLEVGLLSALPMLTNSATQPLWGKLSDKYGRRKLFVSLGEAIAGVAYLLLMRVQDVWLLIVGLSILEGMWAMSNVAWSTIIIETTTHELRGRVMGILSTIGVAGRSFGVFTAGILYDTTGFALNFVVSAVIMFISAALVWLLVDERVQKSKSGETRTLGGRDGGDIGMLWFLTASSSISMFGFMAIGQLLMIYMSNGFGFTGSLIGSIVGIAGIANLVCGVPLGYLSDKVDRRKLYLASLFVNASTPGALLYATTPAHFTLVSAWSGLSWPLNETTAFPLAGEYAPAKERAKYLGLFNSVRFLVGFGLSPAIVGGLFADSLRQNYLKSGFNEVSALVSSSRDTFVLSGFIGVAALLIWMLTFRRKTSK